MEIYRVNFFPITVRGQRKPVKPFSIPHAEQNSYGFLTHIGYPGRYSFPKFGRPNFLAPPIFAHSAKNSDKERKKRKRERKWQESQDNYCVLCKLRFVAEELSYSRKKENDEHEIEFLRRNVNDEVGIPSTPQPLNRIEKWCEKMR